MAMQDRDRLNAKHATGATRGHLTAGLPVVHQFDLASLAATPWKNGGGATQEILCWPPGAGLDAFEWRVSVATIAASGPFSVFAGVARTIMLLDGDGVELHGDGVQHRLDVPHEPFHFAGETPMACTLLGTASRDFNVMARRAGGTAEVRMLSAAETLGHCTHGLLMALRGTCGFACDAFQAGEALQLRPGQGVWWAGSPRGAQVTPLDQQASCVSVQWRPRLRPSGA